MARSKNPTHIWLECDQCKVASLTTRKGPKTTAKCRVCSDGTRRTPVPCPYPELGEAGHRFDDLSVRAQVPPALADEVSP